MKSIAKNFVYATCICLCTLVMSFFGMIIMSGLYLGADAMMLQHSTAIKDLGDYRAKNPGRRNNDEIRPGGNRGTVPMDDLNPGWEAPGGDLPRPWEGDDFSDPNPEENAFPDGSM